nr:F-box/kelch-repeat protein At3g23880-like [Ipomoea batatas]
MLRKGISVPVDHPSKLRRNNHLEPFIKWKPKDNPKCLVFGFGYNERNDDYKDFYAYYADNGNENVVLVYNFKHGSWKRSERGFNSGFVNPRIVMFVSGSLNWCNNNLDASD